ncbi:MAG: cupin domain-containing protein [Acidimicrobiales bacterium]|nr:cupin domain-containing protein [Acidimicrobiales bacterium]
MSPETEAAALIAALGLERHPEGGWFRETWRDPDVDGERGSGTAIYFLLGEGERSHWHRVDAVEIWHHYRGAPLELSIGDDVPVVLGPDVLDGQVPQAIVPAGAWQSARSLGSFTLVGCTVSPAFRFEGFELAPEGWSP